MPDCTATGVQSGEVQKGAGMGEWGQAQGGLDGGLERLPCTARAWGSMPWVTAMGITVAGQGPEGQVRPGQ